MTGDRPRAWNSTLPAPSKPMTRGKGIRPVSVRRRAENRERAAMADRRWPGRREGTVMCAVPWCPRLADDLHEILSRARGGSITDEENTVPVCRPHHRELTLGFAWGYRLGFLRHSGLCCRGRAVCSRYEQTGEAA